MNWIKLKYVWAGLDVSKSDLLLDVRLSISCILDVYRRQSSYIFHRWRSFRSIYDQFGPKTCFWPVYTIRTIIFSQINYFFFSIIATNKIKEKERKQLPHQKLKFDWFLFKKNKFLVKKTQYMQIWSKLNKYF